MHRPRPRPHAFLSPVAGLAKPRSMTRWTADRTSPSVSIAVSRPVPTKRSNSTLGMRRLQKAAGASAGGQRFVDFSACALVSLAATCGNRSRPQNDPDDFGGQLPTLRLQTSLRCSFIFLDGSSRLFNLGLRFLPHLSQGRLACLQRLLPKCFLILENRHARFAQALFIFRSSRFGGGDIGACFLDSSFSFAAPLG